MKVLITGSAGFIGFHTAKKLMERGDTVIGFDNFNEYYDPKLKKKRNEILEKEPNFTLIRGDISVREDIENAVKTLGSGEDTRVLNLAAQAGVRHSIEHPEEFIRDNITGFSNVIDVCKEAGVGGLVYASSSSVYGNNQKQPSQEEDNTDKQVSLYGMTKKSNELEAHVYHDLFGVHSTGLRYFTVYGPWGRPDMALFLFTKWVLNGEPMQIFGEGKMQRDFTYVDDIADGTIAAIDKNYEYEVFNLGAGHTEELMDYVKAVEDSCGKQGEKNMLPMQSGDVVSTSADISRAKEKLGYDPQTRIADGVPKFVEWYREYYAV